MDSKLFVYEAGWSDWLPSTQYRFDGFIRALRVMYLEGVGDMSFYLGEDVRGEEGTKIGLVNIAAFIAQCMKETIKYDACDENNWDIIDGKYPLSNACGQLEQSYQDYTCPPGQEHLQCEVDPYMKIEATTAAGWYGAPAPLFCGPKSIYEFTGYWDYSHMCDFSWDDPPRYCTDYPGQKGGQFVNDEPVANGAGRTDVEGCCWWGRGVIQTTGICNFGTLNYYLGARASREGREARYHDIDFCRDPGAICSSSKYPELKWIAGMFYWIRSLQTYNEGWSYMGQIKAFVRGGMNDDSFINAVSGIVNRGCHNPPCGTGPLDGGHERLENFKKVLEVLFEKDGRPRQYRPTMEPTVWTPPEPTRKPTNPPWLWVSEKPTGEWPDGSAATEPARKPTNPPWLWVSEKPTAKWSGESDATLKPTKKLTQKPTKRPNKAEEHSEEWPLQDGGSQSNQAWIDEEEEEEEDWEDWGDAKDATTSANRLWCGEDVFKAQSNCGRNGYACSDGWCHSNLRCFMVGTDCDGGYEDAAKTPKPTTQVSRSPTKEPTSRPVKATPPPSKRPTAKPVQSIDNTGVTGQFCSTSFASLKDDCFDANQCKGNDDCPSGTFCWPEHTCGEVQSSKPAPVSDTYFCGRDRNHASTSCHKRCRTGERSECGLGESCFAYSSCKGVIVSEESQIIDSAVEQGKAQSEKKNPTYYPTHDATYEPTAPPSTAKPSSRPSKEPTAKPSLQPSPQGTPSLFCAASKKELQTSCAILEGCESRPCPKGKFCFPLKSCDGWTGPSKVTVAPIPAPKEEDHFGAQPSRFQELCPDFHNGWLTLNDCREFYKCSDGIPGVASGCPSGEHFDLRRKGCFPASEVNAECYGHEQEATVDTNNDLCPDVYNGWHAISDCTQYFKCSDGAHGTIYVCPEGQKFDKTRNECFDAFKVNKFCYGPSVAAAEAESSASSSDECPLNFKGYGVTRDCSVYYQCFDGVSGARHTCDSGTKFDRVRSKCMDTADVNSFCYGPSLNQQETFLAVICGEDYTGWRTTQNCRQYFYCQQGYADKVHNCGEDLMFDVALGTCNFAGSTKCIEEEKGNSLPVSTLPGSSPALQPMMEDESPTSLDVGNTTAEPPWLTGTIANINGVRKPQGRQTILPLAISLGPTISFGILLIV